MFSCYTAHLKDGSFVVENGIEVQDREITVGYRDVKIPVSGISEATQRMLFCKIGRLNDRMVVVNGTKADSKKSVIVLFRGGGGSPAPHLSLGENDARVIARYSRSYRRCYRAGYDYFLLLPAGTELKVRLCEERATSYDEWLEEVGGGWLSVSDSLEVTVISTQEKRDRDSAAERERMRTAAASDSGIEWISD